VEGAEDNAEQGARDVRRCGVRRRDAVVGVTASGSTPYVAGALRAARRAGAATIAVTCNLPATVAAVADVTIAALTGPEVIAGSTRMKAGTAQKMVLNMLSTATMVRLGHVYDNWMIDVALSNRKLRRRGERILQEAAGATAEAAARALRQAMDVARPRRHALRVALVMLRRKLDARAAARVLRRAGGDLRRACGDSTKAAS
jgi:N-acetylmuramic acid 6-phosphate etherase